MFNAVTCSHPHTHSHTHTHAHVHTHADTHAHKNHTHRSTTWQGGIPLSHVMFVFLSSAEAWLIRTRLPRKERVVERERERESCNNMYVCTNKHTFLHRFADTKTLIQDIGLGLVPISLFLTPETYTTSIPRGRAWRSARGNAFV